MNKDVDDYDEDITDEKVSKIQAEADKILGDMQDYMVIDGFKSLDSYIPKGYNFEIGPVKIDVKNHIVTLDENLTNEQNWKAFWEEALCWFTSMDQQPKAYIVNIPDLKHKVAFSEFIFMDINQAEKFRDSLKYYAYIQPLYTKSQFYEKG